MDPLHEILEKQVFPPHPRLGVKGSHKKIFLKIYPEGDVGETRSLPS
jgi:hypothetical protein